jgi:hypothetical protein
MHQRPPPPPGCCAYCYRPLFHPMEQTFHGWMHQPCMHAWANPPAASSSVGSTIGKGCAIAFGVGVLILALVVSGGGRRKEPAEEPLGPPPVQHTVGGEWQNGSQLWEAIVVPRGTSDAQLCTLARWLHKKRWLAQFHFFDDPTRVAEYVAWTKAYPAYQRPKPLVDWMRVHHRGLLRRDSPDTYELDTVTADSPLRTDYPCSIPR